MARRLQPAAQKSQGVGKRVPSLKGLGINQRRCPSTHVLGYACAALRAGFVKILYLSLSRDVQGSPLPRDLACFRDATDDLTGAPNRAGEACPEQSRRALAGVVRRPHCMRQPPPSQRTKSQRFGSESSQCFGAESV